MRFRRPWRSLITWGRPRREWANLDQVTRASITNVALRQEVQTMSQAVEQTWAEWAQEHYTALGEERGELRGELRAARKHLRLLLEKHFGPLPESVRLRIEAATDLNQLEAALLQAPDLKTLNEFQL